LYIQLRKNGAAKRSLDDHGSYIVNNRRSGDTHTCSKVVVVGGQNVRENDSLQPEATTHRGLRPSDAIDRTVSGLPGDARIYPHLIYLLSRTRAPSAPTSSSNPPRPVAPVLPCLAGCPSPSAAAKLPPSSLSLSLLPGASIRTSTKPGGSRHRGRRGSSLTAPFPVAFSSSPTCAAPPLRATIRAGGCSKRRTVLLRAAVEGPASRGSGGGER
jgi:hypothetical protein